MTIEASAGLSNKFLNRLTAAGGESYLFFPARWINPYSPCFLVEDAVMENCGADEENRMADQ